MPDNKEETEILVQGDDELLEATDLPEKDEPTEEVEVSIDAEDLKPKPAEKRAPRGIETFTVCRQNDEGGISGTGVVIEGVLFATGQVVLHWLSPSPLGSISIFASMDDFKKIHAAPHKDNKTIITWSDGRQDSW